MLLAQKVTMGSVALHQYLDRKPFTTDQSSQDSLLPIELILLVCDNLSIQDQVRASRISKHWFNALLGLPSIQYLQQYGDAPAHFFAEGFNWHKELKRRETAEDNFNEGRYWDETLAATPSNMHSRRYYLVSSVRGMEVLVNLCYWVTNSCEEVDAEVRRSYSIDLASETSTQKGGAAGVWLNDVLVRPVYNTHGIDWTTFTTYRPPTEYEAENGAYDVSVREHDIGRDHNMSKSEYRYFRITEPQGRLKAVPNSKPGSNTFLIYSEHFLRLKRRENDHTVLFCTNTNSISSKDWVESFDGILAYWGDYIVTSTERSIEFFNRVTRTTDRVYPLDLNKLVFARVGIHGNIMAYTVDDRTIAVWDLKQNKLLTTFNYVKRMLPGENEPETLGILSLSVHGSKVVVNMGWSIIIDWRTKKSVELPFEVEQATFLPDGSLILASRFNVARIRFDVDTTQTVKLTKLVNGELSTEPVVLGQLTDYLTKKYNTHRYRSLTFLIDKPTGYPSYKGQQIHAIARITAFWTEDDETPSTHPFVQALKQLKAPPMTSSVHETQRCSELSFNDFKPKEPVFLYERLIDGHWTPCNPFELNLVK